MKPYHTIFANNSCGRDESDALEVLLAIFSTNGGIVAAMSWYWLFYYDYFSVASTSHVAASAADDDDDVELFLETNKPGAFLLLPVFQLWKYIGVSIGLFQTVPPLSEPPKHLPFPIFLSFALFS